MKHLLLAMGLFASISTFPLRAQTVVLKGKVPFDFHVGSVDMPAGEYISPAVRGPGDGTRFRRQEISRDVSVFADARSGGARRRDHGLQSLWRRIFPHEGLDSKFEGRSRLADQQARERADQPDGVGPDGQYPARAQVIPQSQPPLRD